MALSSRQFSYRGILKKSYQIVKKNKFLWFFGLFAGLFGVGNELNVIFKNYTDIGASTDAIFNLRSLYEGGVFWSILNNIKDFFSAYPWQATLFILVIAVIAVIVIWLATISQISLYDAVNKLVRGRKTGYTEGYQAGNKFFWKVFLINVTVKIVLYGLFLVIAAPLLSWFLIRGNVWGGFLFVILLFFISIPIYVIANIVVRYAIMFIVLKSQSMGQAIKQGWQLFKVNWLVSVEMEIIILLLGLLVGLIIILAFGLSAVPFFFIGVTALLFQSSTGLAVAVVLGVITWLVILAILGSAFISYQYSVWTLLYMELVGEKAESKLVRWFGWMHKK